MVDEAQNLKHANLVTVAERANEMSASIVISILEDAGIRAVATGGFTAGFRAEAPGIIKIQTFEQDAERARDVIAETKMAPLDWDVQS